MSSSPETTPEQLTSRLTNFSIDAILSDVSSNIETPSPSDNSAAAAAAPMDLSTRSSNGTATGTRRIRPKKYKCPYCWVALSNTGQFKGHIRIHTGERPFVCQCGKSFTRNEELTRHKRIHTGLRPYVCPICNKCFGRKDHLKKHQRTHEKAAAAAAAAGAPSTPATENVPIDTATTETMTATVASNDYLATIGKVHNMEASMNAVEASGVGVPLDLFYWWWARFGAQV